MKKIVSLVLVLMMVLSLVACGKEEDSPKKGKDRDGDKTVTGTPTAEPTGEPTGEPTPTPTGEPTPTDGPEPTGPVISDTDIYVGPSYIIAYGSGNDYYSELFTGPGMQAFRSDIDYLYITETGFDALAATIRELNSEAYERNFEMCSEAAEIMTTAGVSFDEPWYDKVCTMVWRNDSVLFSFDREEESYMGGAQSYKYRTGYTIETMTGERVDLATVIDDIIGFSDDIVALLTPYADDLDLWENWEQKVREGIADGELGWVATDDGLQVWFNNGYLAPYTTGEVSILYNVENYPDRFNMAYVGAYDGREKKARPIQSTTPPRSEEYMEVLTYFVDNFLLDFDSTAAFLEEHDIHIENSTNYEESHIFEEDPYLWFYAPDSQDRIQVDFWADDAALGNVQKTIRTITLKVPGYEFFMFITRSDRNYPVFTIVDCSLGDFRDGADVYSLDDALTILFTTMMTYYSDVTSDF